MTHWEELAAHVSLVLEQDQELRDHRSDHPWWSGALGCTKAKVMFIGENPSLRQLERASKEAERVWDYEKQWNISPGDRLLREKLWESGLKEGTPEGRGGWRCYITNVVKEADYAGEFRRRPAAERHKEVERWGPVLAWQLEEVRPQILVAMGNRAYGYVKLLARRGMIEAPALRKVWHYSFVPSFRGNRPELRARYGEQISEIARLAETP